MRLLAETRPAWFFGENVPGLYTVNGGADIAVVRSDLAHLGYWWVERILDAQFFAVPQRRSRVFFVGCPGDRAAPVQVLLEPESSRGDSAPGSQTRPGPAGRAESSAGGAGVTDELTSGEEFMVAHTTGAGWWNEGAGTLRSEGGGGDARGDHLVVSLATPADVMPILEVNGRWGKAGEVRGAGVGHPGAPMYTLQAGKQHAVSTLQAGSTGRGYRIDAEAAAGGHLIPVTSPAITAHHGKGVDSDMTNGFVALPSAVRRLTPLECERLQGLPDGWTEYRLQDGKLVAQKDSARYRQIGNSVAVPCVQWIAGRIVAVDADIQEAS